MKGASEKITVNVGGTKFDTCRSTLFRFPQSLLSQTVQENNDNTTEMFFDRDPQIFRFVLDFYRTGEFHLPRELCSPFIRKEMIYWGIPEMCISQCCLSSYMQYDEEEKTLKSLFRDFEETVLPLKDLANNSTGWKRIRLQCWLFLAYPNSSTNAKVWAVTYLLLIMCSVMIYSLSTHHAFRFDSARVQSLNGTGVCMAQNVKTLPNLHKDCTTEPASWLLIIDILLNVVFSIEITLKLLISPDRVKHLKSFTTVIDVLVVSTYWVYISLYLYYDYVTKSFTDTEPRISLWVVNILGISQVLRILRIFKLTKLSRVLRVLILTIQKSTPELILVGFLLISSMFMFSAMVYMAEYKIVGSFESIPHAFWWSIITLTTVGYGDVFPKGNFGYMVGAMCAVIGCVLTGLVIPVIGNNFNKFYKYLQNKQNEERYIKKKADEEKLFTNPQSSMHVYRNSRAVRYHNTNCNYRQARASGKRGKLNDQRGTPPSNITRLVPNMDNEHV